MLTIFHGNRAGHRRGFSRREFVRLGAFGLGSLTLADMLRLKAQGAASRNASSKSVIMVYLFGGPSHLDMYDMKPDAPVEYRGEFRPIQTRVPGFDICELMPLQAGLTDKLALIRNMKFNPNFHDPVELFSGFKKPPGSNVGRRPDLGSVVSRLRGSGAGRMPPYIALDKMVGGERGNGAGHLGVAHQPFLPGARLEGLALAKDISIDRLNDRQSLRAAFDRLHARLDNHARGELAGTDAFAAQALEMITTSQAREAFDTSREPQRIRDLYGDDTRLLLARRLVEAGVPVVTLTMYSPYDPAFNVPNCKSSWDTHEGNFTCLRHMLPRLDRAIYALITDLEERGLSNDVTVFIGGEMGRTPRIGKSTGNGSTADGRDHWPAAGFALLAGGGLKTGQVIGRTDARGEEPIGQPYTPQNVLATLYRQLGIDPATTLSDASGRPIFLLDDHEVVKELV